MASLKMTFYVLFIVLAVILIQLTECGVEADLGARRALNQLGDNDGYLVGRVFSRRALMDIGSVEPEIEVNNNINNCFLSHCTNTTP